MLQLGTKLPDFNLLNTSNNQQFDSASLDVRKAKLIMFICNHCPYVIHYHDQISDIALKYGAKLDLVAISSNDVVNYPQDAPDKMTELAQKLGWNFPYLYDETQEIAKKYNAACTPEFYLFDQNNLLVYRGRLDDSSPGSNKPATGNDLRKAIDNLLQGHKISDQQYPSMGCNIKWK